MLPASTCSRILKLYSFSWSCDAPGLVPTAFLLLASMVPPWPLGLGWLSAHARQTSVKMFLAPSVACTENPTQDALGVGGGGGCAGGAHGQAGGICGQGIPSGSLLGFLMESMTQLVGSMSFYCPLRVLSAILPVSSCPPVMQLMTQYPWWFNGKMCLVGTFWRAGEPGTHSHAHFSL